MKAWAIFTVIAALVICLPLWTAAVRPFVVGVLVGFGVPSLPSFLLAPPAFVHGIVFAQLHRKTPDKGSTPSATGSSRCSG